MSPIKVDAFTDGRLLKSREFAVDDKYKPTPQLLERVSRFLHNRGPNTFLFHSGGTHLELVGATNEIKDIAKMREDLGFPIPECGDIVESWIIRVKPPTNQAEGATAKLNGNSYFYTPRHETDVITIKMPPTLRDRLQGKRSGNGHFIRISSIEHKSQNC